MGHRLGQPHRQKKEAGEQPDRARASRGGYNETCQILRGAGLLHRHPQAQHAADENDHFPLDRLVRFLRRDAARHEHQQRTEHRRNRQRHHIESCQRQHGNKYRYCKRSVSALWPGPVHQLDRPDDMECIFLVQFRDHIFAALQQ